VSGGLSENCTLGTCCSFDKFSNTFALHIRAPYRIGLNFKLAIKTDESTFVIAPLPTTTSSTIVSTPESEVGKLTSDDRDLFSSFDFACYWVQHVDYNQAQNTRNIHGKATCHLVLLLLPQLSVMEQMK